jgi:hypothetical protein
MTSATDRQYFATALGWIALAGDAVVLGQFLVCFRLEAFWTFRWILSVVFIFAFFGAGVGLLGVGRSTNSKRISMSVFGLAFMLIAIVLYCFWGHYHSAGELSFRQYSGFLVLFGAFVSVAIVSIAVISREYLRFASYGFGVVDSLYLFILIRKYIFQNSPFQWYTFLGEFVVLVLGVVLFLTLFFGSEGSEETEPSGGQDSQGPT